MPETSTGSTANGHSFFLHIKNLWKNSHHKVGLMRLIVLSEKKKPAQYKVLGKPYGSVFGYIRKYYVKTTASVRQKNWQLA